MLMFCKNGSTFKFLHSDIGDSKGIEVESPGKNISAFYELLRIQALHQQSFTFMASGVRYRRTLHITLLQIHLTFPSDSTSREEDVSGYFSSFGPVQDVRIPYQHQRMFGFVTFVYSETVKLILAKGKPHFVCGSRVLVKPYREKGNILDKKSLHEHIGGVDISFCFGPSGIDSREQFDLHVGSRMLFGAQELMLRRKLEQEAELQYAIDHQGRRLMKLRLMDLKNRHPGHPFLPRMPSGYPLSSPRQSQLSTNQNLTISSE